MALFRARPKMFFFAAIKPAHERCCKRLMLAAHRAWLLEMRCTARLTALSRPGALGRVRSPAEAELAVDIATSQRILLSTALRVLC